MSENNIWKVFDDSDIKGYTLIIPSVAVGNVGQLACDLLISSLSMSKIISVYSPALVPVAGYDPYDLKSGNLSSSCEAYKSDARKVVILQLRAPLVFEFAQEFLQDVMTKFKGRGIDNVIVLTSSYAHEKKHIMTSPLRYLSNKTSPYTEKIGSLNWIAHETGDGELKIHGGGFATLIFNICNETNIPCLIMYKYCSEGDNIPDAYDMVTYLTSLVPLFNKQDLLSQLVQPVSWKLLFGRPPPGDIY